MAKDYVPLEKLLPATKGAIYKLVLLAAKRATMIAEGEKVLVEKNTEKVLDLAMEEIATQKVTEGKANKKRAEKSAENKEEKGEKEKAESSGEKKS